MHPTGTVTARRPDPHASFAAVCRAALTIFLLSAPLLAAGKPAWKPIMAEELAETTPRLEPGAPAEIVFSIVDVDDTAFPRERRIIRYTRFKIFVPDQTEEITRRLLVQSTTSSGHIDLVARLVLPNGTVQEFGRDAMKEQTVLKRGGEPGLLEWLLGPAPELREKFLAITGVEAGAVLDYQITQTIEDPGSVETFQPQNGTIPVRRFDYACHTCDDTRWLNRTFALNTHGAHLQQDTTHHVVTFTASNLPTIYREPFSGPPTDYALTIKSCYESTSRVIALRNGGSSDPITIDAKLGAWAAHATFLDWFVRDRAQSTARVKQLAVEITAGARDDEAKARAIHRYVTIMSQKYRRRPGPHPKATEAAASLDDVLDIESKPTVQRPPEEFLWLAIALYRSAGLECRAVMLPDRSELRFDQKEVGRTFLPDRAAAVRLGGQWKFSCPQAGSALPFGLLPWENENQVALLGLERAAQFIPVPPPPADESVAATTGDFSLGDDGTLTGECRRTLTGHAAVALRSRLRSANNKEKRAAVVLESFGLNSRVVSVTVGKLGGIEDAEQPLELACTVRWPDFGTRTKDRLILRGAVLQMENSTPFPATERHFPVQFPYPWKETDHLTIRLPGGFAPEDPTVPPPLPRPDLSYSLKLAYDRAQRVLHVDREFTSQVIDVAPTDYATLKACYDHIVRADRHEVVFRREPAHAEAPASN